MKRAYLVLRLFAASLAVCAWAFVGLRSEGYPLDDAWIHLTYAQSLAEAGSFGYSVGGWENGSTAPLWAMGEALLLLGGVPLELAGKLLGLGSVLLLQHAVARVLEGESRGLAVVAALLIAVDPWVAVLGASGMAPLASVAFAFLSIAQAQQGRWAACGALAAGSCLLRPELGVFVLALSAWAWLAEKRVHAPLRVLALPTLSATLWMLYGFVVSGYPLPNSFRVKAGRVPDLASQLEALRSLLLPDSVPLALLVGAVVLAGWWAMIRRRGSGELLALLAAPLVIGAALVVTIPLGSAWPPSSPGSARSVFSARYSLILLPWLLLWLLEGGRALSQSLISARVLRDFSLRRRQVATAALLSVPAALVALLWLQQWPLLASVYRANCRDIERAPVRMARLINEKLPDIAVIGVSDAGAMRLFVEDRPVIDLIGLNTHQVWSEPDPTQWLIDQQISHAVVWPGWHDKLLDPKRFEIQTLAVLKVPGRTVLPRDELLLLSLRPR